MTRVDFHTHVEDRMAYACRLARKVHTAKMPVLILGDTAEIHALDAALWTFSASDFIPHCLADHPLASETPVVLTDDIDAAPHHAILMNLRAEVPAHFARFERLLEVIGTEESALASGRERYRFYRDQGYVLNLFKQA